MRTRFTDLQQTDEAVYESRDSSGASFTPLSTYESLGRYKSIVDCPGTPPSRREFEVGIIPYRYCDIDEVNITGRPLGFTVTQPGGWVSEKGLWWPGSYGSPIIPPIPGLDSSAAAFVTNAAISDSRSGSWDVLTFAGELAKTKTMLVSISQRVLMIADKIADEAIRLKRTGAISSLSVQSIFSDLWLEGRYGWRPLVREIDNACVAIANRSNEILVKKGSSVVSEDLGSLPAPVVTTASRAIFTGEAERVGKRTYRGFAISAGRLSHVDYKPIQTGWELFTLSFLIDRFIDIGSFLNSITPCPGVDTRYSGFSVQDTWTLTRRLSVDDNPAVGSTLVETQSHEIITEVRTYLRSPRAAGLPSFYPRLDKLLLVDIYAIVFKRLQRIFWKITKG